MQARSAVFDLYGDHLADHGYWAPISAVVTLTQTCGIQPPATRTAVSRMVVQQWLQPRTVGGQRGYAATQAAKDRLRRAHERIYDPGTTPWDGRWHVVVLESPKDRTHRDRLVATMGYLGYGRLSPSTWVSPHRSDELAASLREAGVEWTDFHGPSQEGPVHLVQRVWDLDDLAAAYDEFTFDLPRAGRRRGTSSRGGLPGPHRPGAPVAQVHVPGPRPAGRGAPAVVARCHRTSTVSGGGRRPAACGTYVRDRGAGAVA